MFYQRTITIMHSLIAGILTGLIFISGASVALAGGHNSGGDAAEKACSADDHECTHKQHGKHQKHRGGGRGMFGSELNLSDTQKQDLGALMQLYQPRLAEIRKRGEADRRKLLAMNPDDAAYGQLTDAVAEQAGGSAAEVVVLL